MSEILKTKNYDIFKKHENNRPLDAANLKNIKASIQSRNLLDMRPILVDAKMRVIDGQHRLEAARALDLEIYYQIKREAFHEDIVLLNTHQKIWGRSEYLNYYTSLGNQDYQQLKDFCERRGLSLNESLAIMRSQRAYDEKSSFALGKFKFPSDEDLDLLEERMNNMELVLGRIEMFLLDGNKVIVKSIKTKIGLLKLLSNPECDVHTLIKKISYKTSALRKCADVQGYYEMFRDIYNWNARGNEIKD